MSVFQMVRELETANYCGGPMKCAAIAAIMAPESDEAKPKVEDDSSPKGPNGPKPLTFGEKQ